MIKKLVITIVLVTALLAPGEVSARTVCTQEYGQAVKCYEEEEKVLGVTHEPVEAGLFDNPVKLAVGLLGASLVFAYLSKRKRQPSPFIK